MSFQQGLSGLNAASKQLETIGNNISNASTVGFKASQAQFADVYANSLSGSGGGSSTGIGTKVNKVAQIFGKGNISNTGNSLDMAINGGGFFRLSHDGAITYARGFQGELDKDGYIVANGGRLTGYGVNSSGGIATGSPVELKINNADLPPKMTANVDMEVTVDASKTAVPAAPAFNPANPVTYNDATTATIYDSLGVEHRLQFFFAKTGVNDWKVYAAVDGVAVAGPAAAPLSGAFAIVRFQSNGSVDTNPAVTTPSPITINVPTSNGSTNNFPVTFSTTNWTQFGSTDPVNATTFNVRKQTQDGFASGRLANFNASANGILVGTYTNGRTAVLGQVVLANFANPNGLEPAGNNTWLETSSSGQPLVGVPNSGSLGVLESSAVEESNVDLTSEMVMMITAQRVYQANAQVIKTQDQLTQTLVNLR